MKKPPMTLIDHITRRQRDFPGARGSFTTLMQAITLATKVISREVNRAGLGDLIGGTGRRNVQGEMVARLDEFANDVIIDTLTRCGEVCVMASEELAVPIRLDAPSARPATIHWRAADLTARAPGDYRAAEGSLTIPPGETVGHAVVTVVGDATPERAEVVLIAFHAAEGAEIGGFHGLGAGLIIDDD